MKKLLFPCVLMVFLMLTGCVSGIQVNDNVYDSLAGQTIQVDKDFTYVGQCDPSKVPGTNISRRAAKNSRYVTRSDVFVKTSGEEIEEVAILQRRSLRGKWYWTPASGNVVDFHGRSFKEFFYDANKSNIEEMESYLVFLQQSGYQIDRPDFYIMTMVRNATDSTRVRINYAVKPSLIPNETSLSGEQKREFIRERFNKNVGVVN